MSLTHFAPSIIIDGRCLTPPGWMWVVSFALAGCQWAMEETQKTEFRATMADWIREHRAAEIEQEITHLEQRIEELRARL